MRRPPGPLIGRPADLPPAKILGLRHPHGTKMRYMAGCRGWSMSARYKWLRTKLNLSTADCHIGRFNIEQCTRVIELCGKEPE